MIATIIAAKRTCSICGKPIKASVLIERAGKSTRRGPPACTVKNKPACERCYVGRLMGETATITR